MSTRQAAASITAQTESNVNELAQKAEDMARRGVDVVRDSVTTLRTRAADTGVATVRYVQEEPVKAVLIAAAAGAALMGLASLVRNARRSSDR